MFDISRTNSSIFFDQEILCEVQTLPTNDFSSSDLGFEFDLFATNACLYEKHLLKQEPVSSFCCLLVRYQNSLYLCRKYQIL